MEVEIKGLAEIVEKSNNSNSKAWQKISAISGDDRKPAICSSEFPF